MTPSLRPEDRDMPEAPWISEEVFNAGYLQRSLHLMPKQGDKAPWRYNPDYYTEKDEMPCIDLDEPALVYAQAGDEASASA